MLLFPYLLTGSGGGKYREAANVSQSGTNNGILYWPEVITHFSRTYESQIDISEAIKNLLDID